MCTNKKCQQQNTVLTYKQPLIQINAKMYMWAFRIWHIHIQYLPPNVDEQPSYSLAKWENLILKSFKFTI